MNLKWIIWTMRAWAFGMFVLRSAQFAKTHVGQTGLFAVVYAAIFVFMLVDDRLRP